MIAFSLVLCAAKFRVLTINDVYEFESRKGLGGFAQMSTLLKKHRAESDGPCFSVLNGDFLGGSALAERFKGESVIPVLNAMDVRLLFGLRFRGRS